MSSLIKESENLNRITKIHLNAKLETLIDLEIELKNEMYTTISQVMGHIHNSVEFQKQFNQEHNV